MSLLSRVRYLYRVASGKRASVIELTGNSYANISRFASQCRDDSMAVRLHHPARNIIFYMIPDRSGSSLGKDGDYVYSQLNRRHIDLSHIIPSG